MDAIIEQRSEPLIGADPHMVSALRANILRGGQVAMKDHFPAGGAFVP
jgi:hypothetical protein